MWVKPLNRGGSGKMRQDGSQNGRDRGVIAPILQSSENLAGSKGDESLGGSYPTDAYIAFSGREGSACMEGLEPDWPERNKRQKSLVVRKDVSKSVTVTWKKCTKGSRIN